MYLCSHMSEKKLLDALSYHADGRPGKIEVISTKPTQTNIPLPRRKGLRTLPRHRPPKHFKTRHGHGHVHFPTKIKHPRQRTRTPPPPLAKISLARCTRHPQTHTKPLPPCNDCGLGPKHVDVGFLRRGNSAPPPLDQAEPLVLRTAASPPIQNQEALSLTYTPEAGKDAEPAPDL